MNPLTEQQIDAEVIRYEPAQSFSEFTWCRFDQDGHQVGPHSPTAALTHVLPPELFDPLTGGVYEAPDFDADEMAARTYATREAALADLRNAIRASGTNAAQE